MVHFVNQLYIVMSSLLTESMAYVKEFDYSENVSKLQTSFVNNFSDMSEFLYKYKIQLMVIQILFFMYSMHRYSNIDSAICWLRIC